jgi:hypothetical protein
VGQIGVGDLGQKYGSFGYLVMKEIELLGEERFSLQRLPSPHEDQQIE